MLRMAHNRIRPVGSELSGRLRGVDTSPPHRNDEVPGLQLTEQVSSGVGTGGTTEADISGEQFVEVMPWANGGVSDVRPLPDDDSAFSFYLPGSSMYFVAWVDRRGRLTQQRMVNRGHEIDYEFAYPDG